MDWINTILWNKNKKNYLSKSGEETNKRSWKAESSSKL